ncbi:DUF1080 domain-containing protein [Puniceicoccaceae bacterium K14]|nr:DUF1080 domain-containing protein [Puniceicoccaceae bacterium K14]
MNKVSQLIALACLYTTVTACEAAPKEEWPKGINPATLALNTTPEPNLDDETFVDIFNGTDLTGWSVKGSEMKFEVIDGEIVGTCTPDLRPNSFLSTDKSYSDFIFTAEFKWDVIGNSGIMFRADTLDSGQVFGYQSEMDPSPRAWTGGIYGEAMDGWIYPLSKEEHADARAAVENPNAWNRMTIYARGGVIKTWINGAPSARIVDYSRSEGFFGLQVHSGKKGTIRWKNIKVKEFEPATNLLESNDLSQWTQVDGSAVGEGWTVENGIVSRHKKGAGDIISKEHFDNFEFRFDWKISEAGNSGVKYRTQGKLGLEYQVLDDEKHPDNKIESHLAGALYDLLPTIDEKPLNPVGEWNSGKIVVDGNTFQHWLNGKKVVEIEYDSDQWKKLFEKSKYAEYDDFGSWSGPILLQDHHDLVWFRDLTIRSL